MGNEQKVIELQQDTVFTCYKPLILHDDEIGTICTDCTVTPEHTTAGEPDGILAMTGEPEGVEFLLHPADADTQCHPTVREHVEGGKDFGGDDRVPVGEDQHPRPQAHALACCCLRANVVWTSLVSVEHLRGVAAHDLLLLLSRQGFQLLIQG